MEHRVRSQEAGVRIQEAKKQKDCPILPATGYKDFCDLNEFAESER
jgi:hypothetical protein